MAVSTAWSSGRSAWMATRLPGFSIRRPGCAALLQLEPQPDGRTGLGGRAGELGVALAGMDVTQVEPRPRGRPAGDPVPRGDVADVEVAAPFALAVDAGRHLAVGRDAKRADERRDRPRTFASKCSVPSRIVPLGPGRVAEDLGRVFARELGPARRLAQRPAFRADGDPGIVGDHDLLDRHDQRIAPLGPFDPDRSGDRIGLRRHAVEARPQGRDRLVLLGPDVAVARVERLDLERLAGTTVNSGSSRQSKANLRAVLVGSFHVVISGRGQVETVNGLLRGGRARKREEIAHLLHVIVPRPGRRA